MGLGLRPGAQKNFLLTADLIHIRASEYDEIIKVNKKGETLFDRYPRNYFQDVNQFRIGGELSFPHSPFIIRAGYFTNPPYYDYKALNEKNEYVDNGSFTFGLGMRLGPNIQIDSALVYGGYKIKLNEITSEKFTTELYFSSLYRF